MAQWVSPHSLPIYPLGVRRIIQWSLSSKTKTRVSGTWALAEGRREEALRSRLSIQHGASEITCFSAPATGPLHHSYELAVGCQQWLCIQLLEFR